MRISNKSVPSPLYSSQSETVNSILAANKCAIQRAISAFNWDMAFQNKDIDDKIKILNETLLNIFNYFIPNKILNLIIKNRYG